MPDAAAADATVELWDWRRRVLAIYAAVRSNPEPAQAWRQWRAARDDLFRQHSQSPIEPAARAGFAGLPFAEYDPALRLHAALHSLDPAETLELPAGADGPVRLRPFARTDGLAAAIGAELTCYWIEGYGGGVFLPFADATSGQATYGAGRYLLDTIKGADLGLDGQGRAVLDFNFSYNPSCSYSDRYVCPLAPFANRVPRPILAGELAPR